MKAKASFQEVDGRVTREVYDNCVLPEPHEGLVDHDEEVSFYEKIAEICEALGWTLAEYFEQLDQDDNIIF